MATSVSTRVLLAIEEVDGRDATNLPLLADNIDPDALDTLFDPDAGRPPETLEVSFTYGGYHVRVQGAETVTVEPLDAPMG